MSDVFFFLFSAECNVAQFPVHTNAEWKNFRFLTVANAESALQLLQTDKLLGFSAIYPPGITGKMVRCKIGHTKTLLETELPFRWYSSLFSFNRHPRWTGKDF